MSQKRYGLIVPGQKRPMSSVAKPETSRLSIFNESSDSDNDDGPTQFKMKTAPMLPSIMERRMARRAQEKALEEDPTVFQYDELYDDMTQKQADEKQTKNKEARQVKYIGRLMETAARRKLENELRIERQVQRDREAEGDLYKDKEAFVTSAYRKKLEDLRKLEEQEKRDAYLEAIGDVTKQKDLDGFYRHLFEQKVGTSKAVEKPEIIVPKTAAGNDDIGYIAITSQKPQARAYRKRNTSDDDEKHEEPKAEKEVAVNDPKKGHLTNNIDADSDFSIDSSSDTESEERYSGDIKSKSSVRGLSSLPNSRRTELQSNTKTAQPKTIQARTALILCKKIKDTKNDTTDEESSTSASEDEKPDALIETVVVAQPKVDKSLIWKKRTVGEVFDNAVKRYFVRRAQRSA